MATVTYDSAKHDVGLKRQDGSTTVGFMLAQKDGTPVYSTGIEPALAEQRATGTPGRGWFIPTSGFPLGQSDWRQGISQEIYDSLKTKQYYTSQNMDLRWRGMAICGPTSSSVTLPTTTDPTVTDIGFETWTDVNTLTNWTTVTTTLTREGATVNEGTYSAKLGTANGYIYQDLSTTQIQGRRFTFTCYVKSNSSSAARIAINDGTTTTYGAYHTGSGSWEQLSVTATLGTDATSLQIQCRRDGADTIYFDGAATFTRATVGQPIAHAKFNDNEYVALGGLLTKLDTGAGASYTGVYEFASPITDLKVAFDGFLYIALESTDVLSSGFDIDYDGGGANGDVIGSTAVSTTDLQDFTGLTFEIKVSETVAAGDLAFLLDDDAGCTSPTEAINLPALTAGKKAKVYVRMATPSNNKNVISVGLEYNANHKANIIEIDDIRAESSYYYMDSGENFTQSTLSVATHDSFAKYFQPVGATMWKALPPNNIYSNTDPSNAGGANWSGVTTIDSRDNDITDLESDGASLFISKEDRLFYLVGATVTVAIEQTKTIASSNTGKNTFYWNGAMYFPAGDESLVEYNIGTGLVSWLSPASFGARLATFSGQVFAVAGDDQWLFVVVDNSTMVEILAGRREAVDGVTDWRWHPLHSLTLTGGEMCFVSNVYQKRLWIASTNSSNSFYYIPLPIAYGDVTSDTNKSFLTNGYFETPWLDGGFLADDKAWTKITLHLGHTHDTDIYFEVHYKKWGDTSWTDIGDFKGTSSNRSPIMYLPTKPVSTRMKFKFVAKTDLTSTTPILNSYEVWAILSPVRKNLIRCVIRAAVNTLDKAGAIMTTTAAEIKTVLEEARDATWPFDFYDIDGTTKTVKIRSVMPFRSVVKDEESRAIESHFYLELEEVVLS